MQNRRECRFDIALLVRIIDPQNELATVFPREEPIEQGRADTANV
jgi:hypothetical protein